MVSTFQALRLRRHADYGLVYGASRKHTSRSLSFFYRERGDMPGSAVAGAPGVSRFGITVPRALGGAVLRNRIKRRVRVAAGQAIALLPSHLDVVLHPRPVVATMPFAELQGEIAEIFSRVSARVAAGTVNTPLPRSPRPAKGGRR